MSEQIKISEGATIAARHIYQHKRILFPEEDLPIIAEIIQSLAVAPVEKERDEARTAYTEASAFAQCAYCQVKLIKNQLHIVEHLQACEQHPMRDLEIEIKKLRAELDKAKQTAGRNAARLKTS